MGKLVTVNIPMPKEMKQIPIILDDGWIVSDINDSTLYIRDDVGVKHEIKISSLIDIDHMDLGKKLSNILISSINQMVDTDFDNTMRQRTKQPLYPRTNNKVEKSFYMPKELFEAVDFSNMGIIDEPKNYIPKFMKGEKYSLSGVSCEGFEMPEKVYKLIGIHDSYDGIDINSVIVKQISGDKDKIFTLSKNDCACMGIEYEEGLQLFPKHLNWKRVKDIIPFDKSNLGTSPKSDIDNTIRYVVLKLNGFKDYVDGYILTPSGKIIKESQFADSFKIVSDEPIVYEKPSGTLQNRNQGLRLSENTPLEAELVYPKGITFSHGNFISNDDSIFIMIKLAAKINGATTLDGLSGVKSENLEGFNPNDHFTISWDEMGAYTVEEYELEKAKKEQARKERIAREERERQKRIEEEEKRLKLQRKRTEEAIERMRNYEIDIPTFPKLPKFSMENGLSSLNLYMDGLDLYFDSLDNSLSKLGKDLTNITRTLSSTKSDNNNLFDLFKL